MESLSTPAKKKSKKAPSMLFLTVIILCKAFKDYYVKRIKQIKPWKEIYNSNDCYYNIMLCFIQSSAFSRDHIIAIAHNWIFDSNLPYAIPLNEKSLNWCASRGKSGIYYVTCVEQVIGYAKNGNKRH